MLFYTVPQYFKGQPLSQVDFKPFLSCEDLRYETIEPSYVYPCLQENIANIKNLIDSRGSMATISLIRTQSIEASGTVMAYTSGTEIL